MMKKGHWFIIIGVIVGMVGICLSPSHAPAGYPDKSVKLIVVWGAGGANDAIARSIAKHMEKYFPKPVFVVNRAGGAGTVGTAEIISARPDGYTFGSTTMSAVTIKPHLMKLPYQTPDDYLPVALVGTQAFTLMVHTDMPYKTLKEFVQYAKANAGKVRLGTGGVGHISHLNLEQLKFAAGIDVVDVPFKGGGEQTAAVLGKHVDGNMLTLKETYAQYKAGKVRILAIVGEKRRKLIPEVPTFKEQGYDITMETYTLLICNPDIPKDRVSAFRKAYKKVSKDPEFVKFIEGIGMEVKYEATRELRKRLWRDYKANKGVFDRIGKTKK